jgi:hypothetical protein
LKIGVRLDRPAILPAAPEADTVRCDVTARPAAVPCTFPDPVALPGFDVPAFGAPDVLEFAAAAPTRIRAAAPADDVGPWPGPIEGAAAFGRA